MFTAPVTFTRESNRAILSGRVDRSTCRADGPIPTNAAKSSCCNSIFHWQCRLSRNRKERLNACEMRHSFLGSMFSIPIEPRNSCIWYCAGNATISRPSRFKVRRSSDAGRGAKMFKARSIDSDFSGNVSKMSVTTASSRTCARAARAPRISTNQAPGPCSEAVPPKHARCNIQFRRQPP